MDWILPKILAELTRAPRYKNPIKFDHSLVNNAFRLFELVFWRRIGIRAEVSGVSSSKDKTTILAFHSWEAVLLHLEAEIRAFFRNFFKLRLPVKVWIPMFQPVGSPMPMFASPYLFAIAYDNGGAAQSSSGSTTVGALTFTIAASTSIWAGLANANLTGDATAVVWNTTETLTNAVSRTPGGFTTDAIWYIAAPTSGNLTITATFPLGENTVAAVSLSGTHASPLGATGSNGGTASASTVDVATGTANSWVVDMITVNGIQDLTATGTNQTRRVHFTHDISSGWKDAMSTMTTTSAGTYTPAYSWTPSRIWNGVAVEVKEGAGAGTAQVHPTLLTLGVG